MKFIALIIVLLVALPLQVVWNALLPHGDVPYGRPRALSLDVQHWYHLIDPPGFAVGYGEWLHNPLWVSWKVPAAPLLELGKRPGNFRCATATLVQVCPDDFRHSGFDRGHLAPNYAMSRLHGRAAQLASFSMANITPQRHAMNARAWQRLEEAEMDRLRPEAGEHFWVLSGPVFADRPERLPSGVAIPEATWRVWFRDMPGAGDRRYQVLGFVVPQTATGFEDLRDFAASIDAIETRIGFDLLHRLPNDIESRIEAQVRTQDWPLGKAWTAAPRY